MASETVELPAIAPATVRRGLPVFCSDRPRPVGKVDGGRASPERGEELLVRNGWWEPVVRRVAGSEIASADAKGVRLRFDEDELKRQPVYLPDPELEAAVDQALKTNGTLHYTGLRHIHIQAREGVVRMAGHVRLEAHRREAVQCASATPGVMGVVDDLIADEHLVSAVALAMIPHPELQPSRVRVRADLGKVILDGRLDSDRDTELAITVAGSVPGVVSVESHLRTPEEQPASGESGDGRRAGASDGASSGLADGG
jgi:osmotically-inducible protein OsmY